MKDIDTFTKNRYQIEEGELWELIKDSMANM